MITYLFNLLTSPFSWNPAPHSIHKAPSLHEAVRRPSSRTAHELIKNGADINSKSRSNSSPICDAIYYRRSETACLLLYYGADLEFEELMRHGGYLDSSLLSSLEEDFRDVTKIVLNYCTVADDPRIECYCHELLSTYSVIGIFIVESWHSEYMLAELFLTIVSQINPVLLLNFQTPFLLLYLEACDFSTSNWLKCLYAILEYPYATDLMQHAIYCNNWNSCFYDLIQAFKNRSVKRRDRTAIIWIWLSLGAVVTVDDINMALLHFGYCEEVEALIYGFNSHRTIHATTAPAILNILSLEDNHNFIDTILSSTFLYSHHDAPQTILKILKFFTLSKPMKQRLLLKIQDSFTSDWALFPEIVEILDNCPSLVELSRNQVRRTIKQAYVTIQPYQFFEIIKELNIPDIIKGIILFKEPLYNLEV